MANGSVGYALLEGIDYSCIFGEPSALEACAIFANVLMFDNTGQVLNAKHAEKRAAQYIRAYVDPTYQIVPPLEDWGDAPVRSTSTSGPSR
jgi:hypothetical protein